jgi:hypothetical protein
MMWATRTMAARTLATMLAKGMAGRPARRGGVAPGGGRRGSGGNRGRGDGGVGGCDSCILQGLFAFYCEDIFVWYFYDVWGE